jgi:hypothetical protein
MVGSLPEYGGIMLMLGDDRDSGLWIPTKLGDGYAEDVHYD